ncbi:uncharacterized protein METZ01_LOCUS135470, partial [marine metagenome]
VCGKYEATLKDYRESPLGTIGSVRSCKWCFNLNDVAHHRVTNENLDPKDLYNNEES